jgi:hypothetical protein
MDGETVFVCREDQDGELELTDEKFEQERGRGELVRACLALCLYVVSVLTTGRRPTGDELSFRLDMTDERVICIVTALQDSTLE